MFETETLYFNRGNLTKGGFQLVSRYKGLVVGMCSRLNCPYCNYKGESFYVGFYQVKLERCERSARAFYIAHNPKPVKTAPSDLNEAILEVCKSRDLKIIPLGHMGQVGASCFAYEWENEILIVDFGIDVGGVDQSDVGSVNLESLPNFRFIAENLNRISGIFITHGHFDHIGGLPYLSSTILSRVPIYATKLAKRLIERVFKRANLSAGDRIIIHEFIPGDNVKIGNFQLKTFPVAHSIPETCGFFLLAGNKKCVHLGDFKFNGLDSQPKLTLIETLTQIRQEGPIDLLIVDAINAEENGLTPEEKTVFEGLYEIISCSPGRVIVTCFATNFDRIRWILKIAGTVKKSPVFLGTAMQDCAEIGVKEYGFQTNLEGKNQIYLVTGCQAEAGSILRSASEGIDSHLIISPDDTIVISSRPIPGNEERFKSMVLKLAEFGAKVFVDKKGFFPEFSGKEISVADLHVSGHGSVEDLKLVLTTLQPQKVLPFHGSKAALVAFRDLVTQTLPNATVLFVFQNQEVQI